MLTMTVLAFLPHLRPLVITLCWKPVQWLCIWRCCTASNQVRGCREVPKLKHSASPPCVRLLGQSSLNSMYDGIKFDIAVKYAAMLNMAAISMLYSYDAYSMATHALLPP